MIKKKVNIKVQKLTDIDEVLAQNQKYIFIPFKNTM